MAYTVTNSRKMFDVTLERTQRLSMTVGILAENEKEAERLVMAMQKVHRDAGWFAHPASDPRMAGAKERPGRERLGRKGRPTGRWDYPAP